MKDKIKVRKNREVKSSHCVLLSSEEWDEKELHWQNKPFLAAKYKEFMHIPLNYGRVLSRAYDQIEKAGGQYERFALSGEEKVFSSSLMIPLKERVSGLDIVNISGTFLTKLFEGQSYAEAGKWTREMINYVRGKEKEVKKLWFWYATCPRCAKELKKIQTVIFAEAK